MQVAIGTRTNCGIGFGCEIKLAEMDMGVKAPGHNSVPPEFKECTALRS